MQHIHGVAVARDEVMKYKHIHACAQLQYAKVDPQLPKWLALARAACLIEVHGRLGLQRDRAARSATCGGCRAPLLSHYVKGARHARLAVSQHAVQCGLGWSLAGHGLGRAVVCRPVLLQPTVQEEEEE